MTLSNCDIELILASFDECKSCEEQNQVIIQVYKYFMKDECYNEFIRENPSFWNIVDDKAIELINHPNTSMELRIVFDRWLKYYVQK